MTNEFIANDEQVYRQRQMSLSPVMNAFIASNKDVSCWRRIRVAPQTDAFSAGDERVENMRSLYFSSDLYCTWPMI